MASIVLLGMVERGRKPAPETSKHGSLQDNTPLIRTSAQSGPNVSIWKNGSPIKKKSQNSH